MMRRTRVSVDVAWSLNWLWFSNHVYRGRDYRPPAPEYARETWDYTRPRDTAPETSLAQWRAWRHALWAQLTKHSPPPEAELAGCDAPGFASLAHTAVLRAQLAHDWEAFQRWWSDAEPELTASVRSPEMSTALAAADRAMPDGHTFTIFVVGLRAPQTQGAAQWGAAGP